MAIEKYVTQGIVLEMYDQGEHDRVFNIFTREFGLLMCHAKSIRKLESKLRPHVLPRSVTLLTLVKGKEVWRIVGAEKDSQSFRYLQEGTQLLKRFIKGEGSHSLLYDRLLSFFKGSSSYGDLFARTLLYCIILADLGYIDITTLGVKGIQEYHTLSLDELYTRLVLNEKVVRTHLQHVLKEMQL